MAALTTDTAVTALTTGTLTTPRPGTRGTTNAALTAATPGRTATTGRPGRRHRHVVPAGPAVTPHPTAAAVTSDTRGPTDRSSATRPGRTTGST